MRLPVFNQENEEQKKIGLDPDVFDGGVNSAVLYQTALMYRANLRCGLAESLTRGEVSGGGKKPWRQKGTGRARAGSIRSGLWRKGGVIFGPHSHKFGFSLPKKIKAVALKSSLNAKLNENNLLVLEEIKFNAPKTKPAKELIENLKLKGRGRLLIILDEIDANTKLSFRNINFLDTVRASEVNAHQIISARKLIITPNALKILTHRVKRGLYKPEQEA